MATRLARPDDAGAIHRVARASWHATYDDLIGATAVDGLVEEWYAIDDLVETIDRGRSPMFVYEGAAGIVGFAQGGPSAAGPADAVISRIYVVPDRWGEGIGSALLTRLLAALGDDGHGDVWLTVLAENEVGRSFYAGHGFEEHGRRAGELAGEEVEEIALRREL